MSERWKVPTDCRELAELVAREHTHVHQSSGFGAEARLRLLERCDAWRRPERFAELLWACECDARGRLGLEDRDYPQRERLRGRPGRDPAGGPGRRQRGGDGARRQGAGDRQRAADSAPRLGALRSSHRLEP